MRVHVGAGELLARLILATLVALTSGVALAYLFAFCTLVGGGLPDDTPAWWLAVLGKLFLSADPGVASWPLAALLVVSSGLAVHVLGVLLGRIGRDLAADADGRPRSPDAEPGAAADRRLTG